MTKIDVIRHGEPEGGRRYRGYGVDDPLTETGWRQMWDAVENRGGWTHIASSPLQRCRAFAEVLGEKLGIEVSVHDDLKEIGFGAWEGKTPDEILAADPGALDHFYADPVHNRPEGAEPLDSFSQRVWKCYQQLTQQHAGGHVLIVGHAGVARAIAANVLGMSLDNVYSRLGIVYGGIISTQIAEGKLPKLVVE